MIGAGSLFASAMLAATPELGPPRDGAVAKPISAAVAIGGRLGTVTSIYRSPAHNRSVGGAPNSYHLVGRAIDIARRPGVAHAEIATALRRAGFVLLESLDEGDHSHFAFGTSGQAPKPRLSPLLQLASASAPTCPVKGAAALGRRRPGADDVCLDEAKSEARYRSLETAP